MGCRRGAIRRGSGMAIEDVVGWQFVGFQFVAIRRGSGVAIVGD